MKRHLKVYLWMDSPLILANLSQAIDKYKGIQQLSFISCYERQKHPVINLADIECELWTPLFFANKHNTKRLSLPSCASLRGKPSGSA